MLQDTPSRYLAIKSVAKYLRTKRTSFTDSIKSVCLHGGESAVDERICILGACNKLAEYRRGRWVVKRPSTDRQEHLEGRIPLLQCRRSGPKEIVSRGHLHELVRRGDERESIVKFSMEGSARWWPSICYDRVYLPCVRTSAAICSGPYKSHERDDSEEAQPS